MKTRTGRYLLALLALSLVFFLPPFDAPAQAQSAAANGGIKPIGKPVEIEPAALL